MRKLTITRNKAFAACLVSMKIYIEDPAGGELVINNVPCRKLGQLKNGQTQTFEIPDKDARIYVISDKLSKSYNGDMWKIPAGEENVILSGQCFSSISGNNFRFSGVADEEVTAYRTATQKKGRTILTAAAVIGVLAGILLGGFLAGGWLDGEVTEKTFASSGMQITMTSEYRKVSYQGYTVCYSSKEAAMFALKESFSDYPQLKSYTLKEYAELVIQNNSMQLVTPLRNEDGLMYFEYQNTNGQTDQLYSYFAAVYQSDEGFWLVQFGVENEKYEQYRESFVKWARSVTFES